MGKSSGSDLYFDLLRNMSPSSRLKDAIQEAENIARVAKRQRAAAAERAARSQRQAKKATQKRRVVPLDRA